MGALGFDEKEWLQTLYPEELRDKFPAKSVAWWLPSLNAQVIARLELFVTNHDVASIQKMLPALVEDMKSAQSEQNEHEKRITQAEVELRYSAAAGEIAIEGRRGGESEAR